jgi:hypothetical protein
MGSFSHKLFAVIYETCGSHSSADVNLGLLGCNAKWICMCLPAVSQYLQYINKVL